MGRQRRRRFRTTPRRAYSDLRKEMVAEAAKLGGQALILGPKSTDSEFIFTGVAMIQSDRRRLTGEVIVSDLKE